MLTTSTFDWLRKISLTKINNLWKISITSKFLINNFIVNVYKIVILIKKRIAIIIKNINIDKINRKNFKITNFVIIIIEIIFRKKFVLINEIILIVFLISIKVIFVNIINIINGVNSINLIIMFNLINKNLITIIIILKLL